MKEFLAAQKKVDDLEKPIGKGLNAEDKVEEPTDFAVPQGAGPIA